MDPHAGKIVINDAPGQSGRWLPAMDPDYAPVDGRSYPELLDFAVRFGALIRYYDLANRPEGDWVDFFLADPEMLLAAIAAFDSNGLRNEYVCLQRETARARPFEPKLALLREVFGCVMAEARMVNGWLATLGRRTPLPGEESLRRRIVQAVEDELRDALQRLEAYDEGAMPPTALGQAIGLDYDGFLPLWHLGHVPPDSSIYQGSTRGRRIDHALPHIDPLFYAFFDAIDHLQLFAREALTVPSGGGDHKPHIALYMAFLRLFGKSQDTINTFAARYAELYDRRVLREPPAGPLPDRVYLTFALAAEEGVSRETIPGGTLFVAGQDSIGNDILYAADHDLTVTSATIAKLRTLYVEREPLFDDGTPQRVLTAEIPPDTATPWPTFGGPSSGSAAAFGFALASQVLLLTSGDRSVRIHVRYCDPELDARLEALSRRTGLAPANLFATVFGGAFALVASTRGAWFPIDSYDVEVADDAHFVLQVFLPPSAPPLTAFHGSEEGAVSAFTNPAPALPVIEAWLRQEAVVLHGPLGCAEVFPLSLLSTLEVEEIDIRVHVEGLADLTLQNTDGLVDPTQPYPLFGAVPVAGSSLRIGSVELFTKTPEWLSVNVTWFNLPPNADGFKGYYRDYRIGLDGKPQPGLFDNRVFRGAFRVLHPGAWTFDHLLPGEGVFLFRTRDAGCRLPEPSPDGPLCEETRFDTLVIAPADPPPYYDPAASALVLELAGPPYAFGNVLYAPNVLSTVIADLPDTGRCQQKCLGECRPFDEAGRCIDDCLAACEGQPPETCLAPCLERCAGKLLRTAIDRLLRCLDGCAEAIDVEELRVLGADSLRNLLIRVRSYERPDDDCIRSCFERFDRLAEPAQRLYDCLTAPDPVQCARDCREKLRDAYKACLEACMTDCLEPKKDLRYPNDPWLPMVQAVHLDYRARDEAPALIHLLPFGGFAPVGQLPAPLVPSFPDQGVLYLGFAGLAPPQTLPLLFRMAANDDPAAERPPVRWEYLSANRWTPFDPAQVPRDTTNDLENSGVVTMILPSYDAAGGTFFDDDLRWLRAVVKRDAARFPRTAAIEPHALTATWQSGGAESLGKPLPAGTITAALRDLPFIEAVEQPLESFGGRAPEDARAYAIRLGERLRHKERAILGWDYERMVLERFPTVWRTGALPARDPSGGRRPGSVLVVIVPGPETQEAVDPLAPRAPGDSLARIESYLRERASPFVSLRVVNAQYVRVEVTAVVQFADAAGGGIDRLNEDLIRYLSPWTPDADRGAKSSRYYTEDEISDFIQSRRYVASLIDIGFTYEPEPATLEWYLVTSAPRHLIIEDETPEPCR